MMADQLAPTIQDAILEFIDLLKASRSSHTARAYGNALKFFRTTLLTNNIDPLNTASNRLPEDAIAWLASDLRNYSPATERLYLTAVFGFYEFLSSTHLASPNLARLRILIKHRVRKAGIRLPQFPKNSIEELLSYAINIASNAANDKQEFLRNLRDRAFLLTLADSGLRVHEACSLRRGDIDWNEGRALVIGKGNQQAVVRFSGRTLESLKTYLNNRSYLDGSSGRPLASLAVFARHDKGAGKKIIPITTATGRNIVAQRVREALGENMVGLITPHSLRHYFVTIILQASGNLKLAQELARHRNISVTQRYAHLSDDELDQGYHKIFNE
jgi:integrase/recombinase XerC